MKVKQRTFRIEDNMYGVIIYVIIGDDRYFQKWMTRNKDNGEIRKDFYAEAGKLIMSDGSTKYYIRLRDFQNTNYHFGVVAHELLHIAFYIMEAIGFQFSYDNTEPVNYYFESLIREFYKKIIK